MYPPCPFSILNKNRLFLLLFETFDTSVCVCVCGWVGGWVWVGVGVCVWVCVWGCVCLGVGVFPPPRRLLLNEQNSTCNARGQASDVVLRKWLCVKYLRRHIINNHSRDLQANNCARGSIKLGRATRNKRQLLKLSKSPMVKVRSIATFLLTKLRAVLLQHKGGQPLSGLPHMPLLLHKEGALTRWGLSNLV